MALASGLIETRRVRMVRGVLQRGWEEEGRGLRGRWVLGWCDVLGGALGGWSIGWVVRWVLGWLVCWVVHGWVVHWVGGALSGCVGVVCWVVHWMGGALGAWLAWWVVRRVVRRVVCWVVCWLLRCAHGAQPGNRGAPTQEERKEARAHPQDSHGVAPTHRETERKTGGGGRVQWQCMAATQGEAGHPSSTRGQPGRKREEERGRKAGAEGRGRTWQPACWRCCQRCHHTSVPLPPPPPPPPIPTPSCTHLKSPSRDTTDSRCIRARTAQGGFGGGGGGGGGKGNSSERMQCQEQSRAVAMSRAEQVQRPEQGSRRKVFQHQWGGGTATAPACTRPSTKCQFGGVI